MRTIVFVNPSTVRIILRGEFLPPLPGTEKAALYLARRLARDSSVAVHYVGNVEPGVWEGVRLSNARDLRTIILRQRVDSVIWIRTYGAFADLRAAAYWSQHILWTGDCVEDLDALVRRGEVAADLSDSSSIWPNYDAVVFVSGWQRRQWLERFNELPASLAIYNMTPDPPTLYRRSSSPPPWLVVGFSHPRKSLGMFCFIARWITSMRSDFKFVVASSPLLYGDGEDVEVLVEYGGCIRSMGKFRDVKEAYSDVVQFVDPLGEVEMRALMSKADYLLHLDQSIETCSNVTIEAMKHGVLPIVSAKGALPEVCDQYGVVIEGRPGERAFASAAVAALANDAKSGIEANQELLLDRFGEDTIEQRWRELLRLE